MSRTLNRARYPVDLAWHEAVFSLGQARRALRYIARILSDAADAFRQAQRCRLTLNNPLSVQQRTLVEERRNEALRRLNAAIDECNTVGVDLIDIPRGEVRFNVLVYGRRTNLTWRLGQPVDNAWPEVEQGQPSFTPPDAAGRTRDSSATAADQSAT